MRPRNTYSRTDENSGHLVATFLTNRSFFDGAQGSEPLSCLRKVRRMPATPVRV